MSSLQALTSLEYLDISWCGLMRDSGVVPAISNLLKLRELKIAQMYLQKKKKKKPFLGLKKNHEEDYAGTLGLLFFFFLNLGIYHITDTTCAAIAKLKNLQILDLEEDFHVTPVGLQSVFTLTSLKHLNIR